MCSIILTKDNNIELLKELVDLNQEKGTFANSLTHFNNDNLSMSISKKFGLFNDTNLKLAEEHANGGGTFIIHLQAPTGGMTKDITRMHPACNDSVRLFHNGLMKNTYIKSLMKELETPFDFDTDLMSKLIKRDGLEAAINQFEGSFACFCLIDNKVYIFRSKHSKLYTDMKGSFSSEKLNDDWKCINYDTIYDADLNVVGTFKTKSYNFIVEGEI